MHPPIWSEYLGLAEFVANNAMNASMGYSSLMLNAAETPTLLESLSFPKAINGIKQCEVPDVG